jgi:AraC-like DNA-binding protein
VDTRLTRSLVFEKFAIDHLVDSRKRYRLDLEPAFPFAMKLFSYETAAGPFPLNWHERLELFMPLSGAGEFHNGDHRIPFEAGDILVVDNLKLHGIANYRGKQRRAIVITFLPEFVYALGSPLCDSLLLTPFYRAVGAPPAVVHGPERPEGLDEAVSRLVQCYLEPADGLQRQTGCKVFLVQLLYCLIMWAGESRATRSEWMRRQEESESLGRLHAYLLAHFDQKVSIAQAASLMSMSESKFMRYFRTVTGETFVSYLTRLRLERAAQLLEESALSIAEIATAVGFSDQSYFDRVFRRHFGRTPISTRRQRDSERASR